jgi:pimeloyl-ACP methyl ester carboxylesterase
MPLVRTIAFASLFALCCVASLVRGAERETLPRKEPPSPNRDEVYAGVTVLYDAIRDRAGNRLRLIATHPDRPQGRFPTIFVVGWLSCDTVEARLGTTEATQLMLQAIARLPGFATVRLEKAGVGDSQGTCAMSDFAAELAAYRQAFRYLSDYAFVDSTRIFLFGISNGAGFAPLVAEGAAIKGYVIDGGWIKTWYEHMLEIERRRLGLAGHHPNEINGLMKAVELLYSAYLLERKSPQEIFLNRPALKSLWEGDPNQQYGRPIAYYQQLQDLDLMAAWSAVRQPVLAMHGEYDWIMSASDLQQLVELVNGNSPGSAEFVELEHTGHTFEHYDSQKAAFAGEARPFDEALARKVGDWFMRHRWRGWARCPIPSNRYMMCVARRPHIESMTRTSRRQ